MTDKALSFNFKDTSAVDVRRRARLGRHSRTLSAVHS